MRAAETQPRIDPGKEAKMKIRDLMTTEVVTVTPQATLKDAALLLAEHRISGVPVVDDEQQILGVLSEADILVREGGEGRREGLLGWFLDPGFTFDKKVMAKTVEEAMTAPAITVGPDVPVHKAAGAWWTRQSPPPVVGREARGNRHPSRSRASLRTK
jgi:CBS domain-containing protein